MDLEEGTVKIVVTHISETLKRYPTSSFDDPGMLVTQDLVSHVLVTQDLVSHVQLAKALL
eukprot:2367594-Amphidinium_carterae.1